MAEVQNTLPEDFTPQQEMFCQNYVKNVNTRGNGTLSYGDAYGYDFDSMNSTREKNEDGTDKYGTSERDKAENVCSTCASKLLRIARIQDRIDVLWNELLSDHRVDAELSRLVFTAKQETRLGAVKEYNRLRQRIIERQNIVHEFADEKKMKEIQAFEDRVFGRQIPEIDNTNTPDE